MSEELIAKNIKKLRQEKKITLQELADMTGLTKGYLSKIERSEKAPPYSTVNRIAIAFDEEAVFKHEGEEFLYVLEGVHEFDYDGRKYIMKKGDSVYFDAGVPHTGRSIGKKKAKLLAVLFNYRRKPSLGIEGSAFPREKGA